MQVMSNNKQKKIIHVDMDCFYAAIEIRDNPSLANKPVAVGGSADRRGVICTCNYIARQYGVHSAMPTRTALKLCPELILLPVNMAKYKQVAKKIHAVFHEFTHLVEPLALDEAYLDVTECSAFQGSATLIAKAIRERILHQENLTASAGVAPNKFLAKVASGWKKPDGLFVITPREVKNFVKNLAVEEIFGVGKVTAKKLKQLGLKTCADLQKCSLLMLIQHFGKFGQQLYDQCRGIDNRLVKPDRVRKSLSVECTFSNDLAAYDACIEALNGLYQRLVERLELSAAQLAIKNQFIKIKYADFHLTTAEMISEKLTLQTFIDLFQNTYQKKTSPIRLLGIGVHFKTAEIINGLQQQVLMF
ncbi:MAG: dinB [Gammaproteobacteria bacterium]|jgi:DNA polymerase-4|nr:dinB [Gammaproteobacteria bacterium]